MEPLWRRFMQDGLGVFVSVALILLVYWLPPDTSLSEMQRVGVLRVCTPVSYPPLITGNSARPGIDMEIVEAIAGRLDVRVQRNPNSAIGQDWNPRQWRLTRAQCQMVVGGVIDSRTTRSFMDVTPSHAETGWALVFGSMPESLEGTAVAVYTGASGLDRIALSRFLRNEGARAVSIRSTEELVSGLASGRFEAGVTEALLARQLAGEHGWTVQWLPMHDERVAMAFGLWRGDTTLKRAIVRAMKDIERSGELAAILARYELAPVEGVCQPCS